MANPQILGGIKQMLGIAEDYTVFDQEIIVHINAAFFWLDQLGVGPGVIVVDEMALWTDVNLPEEVIDVLKLAVWMKTRLLFDPPNSAYVTNSMTQTLKELTWRLQVEGEHRAIPPLNPT